MYRSEHPNPQFKRDSYECLNGAWEFEKGSGKGKIGQELSSRIEVPFCMESPLSGIGSRELVTDCVYAKTIFVSEEDVKGRLVLHFGAVDYLAEVYCNGTHVCTHAGGYTPFEADLSGTVKVGENRITVLVHDDVREDTPSGKQTQRTESHGCFYTRTTGIWQTVWLERTPKEYIRSFRFFAREELPAVEAEVTVVGEGEVTVKAFFEDREVGCTTEFVSFRKRILVPLSEKHLWDVGEGNLYDVVITFGEDQVKSYFGLRSVRYEGKKFLLNGKSLFQRFVLIQGYYPDGVYTPQSTDEIKRDIEPSRSLGFNGARLHQKLFDPVYLYECDRAGFPVWEEYASWGLKYETLDGLGVFLSEWKEAMERDFNHPCIVQWCPLNEVWMNYDDPKRIRDMRFVEAVFAFTKALDDTRPCVDVSGGYHGRYTDLFDFHCYHSAEEVRAYLKALRERGELTMDTLYPQSGEYPKYDGVLPLNASEYGGVAFSANAGTGHGSDPWGYRTAGSEEDFVRQYTEVTEQLLDCEELSGFCYTQLYDVEQEQNGLFTYDRKPKLSEEAAARIRDCNLKRAAIETVFYEERTMPMATPRRLFDFSENRMNIQFKEEEK